MPAIDTVYTYVANPGAGPTATAAAAGDSLNIRDFNSATSKAYLEQLFRRGATAGYARIRSPRLHDNVTGINAYSSETEDTLGLPIQASQPLWPNDALIVEMSGGAAETDAAVFLVYYENLAGASARLAHWADIMPLIKSIKEFQVAAPAGANAWTDTAFTTTENQLHADSDYAILGLRSSAAVGALAVKGPDTGNLRVGCPGATLSLDTEDWYIRNDVHSGYGERWIPVINANNRFSTYVSAIDVAAVAGLIVTVVAAELSQRANV
jgi:hypothetical protein